MISNLARLHLRKIDAEMELDSSDAKNKKCSSFVGFATAMLTMGENAILMK